MPSLKTQKTALREEAAHIMAGFDEGYLKESDTAIFISLLERHEVATAQTIFCYVSVGTEPGTHGFVKEMLARGKTVLVPRCPVGKQMEARRITSLSQLSETPYGLLEPGEDAPLADPASIDLVVAPCVAAAKDGGRLGHGAAFYDRFLRPLAAPTLCLCRGKLLWDRLPMGEHDIYMDAVLTEDGTYTKSDRDR